MAKRYKIPIVYQKIEYYNVEAENLQEAVTKTLQEFLSTPEEGYLDDSFEIDGIVYDNYPGESYNIDEALNSVL